MGWIAGSEFGYSEKKKCLDIAVGFIEIFSKSQNQKVLSG